VYAKLGNYQIPVQVSGTCCHNLDYQFLFLSLPFDDKVVLTLALLSPLLTYPSSPYVNPLSLSHPVLFFVITD